MSAFHSTVSRRTFMKALGLSAAGIGAAGASAPVFRDLDELMSSEAFPKKPWWVKTADKPTVEIDWDVTKRYDRRLNFLNANIKANYYPKEQAEATATGAEYKKTQMAANAPGYTRKTRAFSDAYAKMMGTMTSSTYSFAGITGTSITQTPTELGVPKWEGTPEENSRLLAAAARIYGAIFSGFTELDNAWRNKLVISHTIGTAGRIVYEDVDLGYSVKDPTGEMAEKWVIPTKPMWGVGFAAAESLFAQKVGPSLTPGNHSFGRTAGRSTYIGLFNLLRTLGYQFLGTPFMTQNLFNSSALHIMTGNAEASRQNNFSLSPIGGPRFQSGENGVTDLPLAPTNPIDAGMFRFCHSCGKCADACPPQAISLDKKPSWEIPLLEGKPDTTHNAGVKSFWLNWASCTIGRSQLAGRCEICWAVCPFNEGREAVVHDIIKAVTANTGIFGGFFTDMSKAFGYGVREGEAKEDWWNEPQSVFGVESEIFAKYER